jgi:exosortase
MADSWVQKRWLIYFFWVLLCALAFWSPLHALFQLADHDETASHILLVPFISAWLIYTERKQLHEQETFDYRTSLLFFVPALLLTLVVLRCPSCSIKESLSGFILALILFLVAGFIAILGKATAKSSWFALAFLLFAVPLPEFFLNRVIYELQSGSAAVAELLFNLSGTPVLREGFFFYLPAVSIEVAQECSGIRSSMALLILALLVAHFAFRPFWKKVVFVIAGLLMMLLKNGLRIATLTLLANYVNRDFLYGRLHHQGGIVFFLMGLALLLPVYWLLRRGETTLETGEKALAKT